MKRAKRLLASEKASFSMGLWQPSISANGFPIVVHSDGRVCWPITDYLIHKRSILRRRIGTVQDTASSLALLLSFLDVSNSQFESMCNQSLVDFRDFLLHQHGKGKSSQINKHLNQTINFLLWFDNRERKHGRLKHRLISISTDESHVEASIEIFAESVHRKRRNSRAHGERRYHESFLQSSIPEQRHPVPSNTLDLIWEALPKVCDSMARRHRNEIALLLLEFAGARRTEIFTISVDDCLVAIRTGSLRVITAKREGHQRYLEIPPQVIDRLDQYINFVRAPIISAAIDSNKIKTDHGKLLITVYGTPWKPKSLNKELELLVNAAGIDTRVSPHLFRHRHFTKLANSIRNLDAHKKQLLLKSRGGWASTESINHYIDVSNLQSPEVTAATSRDLGQSEVNASRRHIRSKIGYLARHLQDNDAAMEELNSLKHVVDDLLRRLCNQKN